MSLWKVATIFWLPASVVVTGLAVANIANAFFPGSVAWADVFSDALKLYGSATTTAFAPAGKLMNQYAGFGVAPWVSDALVAYASMASGIAFGGANLTTRQDKFHALRSTAASVGWPLAILGFVFTAFRTRVVTRFAGEHTLLFLLYVAGVAAVVAAGIWGPALLAG